MNPFEVAGNRRRRRSVFGEESLRSTSEESTRKRVAVNRITRNLSLLHELQTDGRRGSFVDLRFGEHADLPDHQKWGRRMERLRLRRLKDQQTREINSSDSRSGDSLLTHAGKPLLEIPDALLEADGVVSSDEELISGKGPRVTGYGISSGELIPATAHFGGGGEVGEASAAPKSRKEVYREIIAKSKAAKAQKSIEKEEQSRNLEQLDTRFSELVGLLQVKPSKFEEPRSNNSVASNGTEAGAADEEYDRWARSLALERPSRPTERVRTASELAAARLARLEQLETERLQSHAKEEEEFHRYMAENEATNDAGESDDTGEGPTEEGEASETTVQGITVIEELNENDTGISKNIHHFAATDAQVGEANIDETGSRNADEIESEVTEVAEIKSEVTEVVEIETEVTKVAEPESKVTKVAEIEREVNEASENRMNQSRSEMKEEVRWKEEERRRESRKSEVDECSYYRIPGSGHEIENETIISESPNWARNSPEEKLVPFLVSLPDTFDEFQRFLSPWAYSTQWKLIHRMRASLDPAVASDSRVKMEKLFIYLITYVATALNECFNPRRWFIGPWTRCHCFANNSQAPGFRLCTALEEHLVDLASEQPAALLDYACEVLGTACSRRFPHLRERLGDLRGLEVPFLSEIGPPCPAPPRSKPTVSELAHIYLLFIIFRGGEKETSNCPSRRLAMLLLDSWGSSLSGADKWTFAPHPKEAVLFSSSLGCQLSRANYPVSCDGSRPSKADKGISVAAPSLLEVKDVYFQPMTRNTFKFAFALLAVQFRYVMLSGRYLRSLLPLLVRLLLHATRRILTRIAKTQPLRIDVGIGNNSQAADRVVLNWLRAARALLQALTDTLVLWAKSSGLSCPDILLFHIVLPALDFLLGIISASPEDRRTLSFKLDIKQRLEAFHNLAQQPLEPLNRPWIQCQGIHMFTPRYADPRLATGRRFLLTKCVDDELLQSAKLRRQLKDANRSTSRQLRRDAQFLAVVAARERQNRNAHQNAIEQRIRRELGAQ